MTEYSGRRYDTFASSHSSLPSSHDHRDWGDDTPYDAAGTHTMHSISDKFSLTPDPSTWGSAITDNYKEEDDAIHNPTVQNGRIIDEGERLTLSLRGLANIGCLFILCALILMLFIGYPILTFWQQKTTIPIGHNMGVNSTGQVPEMGNFGLIDLDTPEEAYTITSLRDGSEWTLVFSDEFEQDNRTFYPGDDPYFEAVDLHYWGTNNMEWYSPAGVTTGGGAMLITLSEKPSHGLDYEGGLVQTWNKFCFTGGYIETSVRLPGISNIVGLWPAVWTMGNLGRAGYGATLEGTWPYTYDACDVGTAPNQTIDGLPEVAATTGSENVDYALSYLPGQKLSRCTCPGESHPGPMHSDGTFVGRAAPEIDIFEAQVSNNIGEVSQSGQWAPFNEGYVWDNSSANFIVNDETVSMLNSYIGGITQQATSVVSETDPNCYQLGETACFSIYGYEYKPGFADDDAYITWVNDGKIAWTINAAGVGADSRTEISARPIPQEPMYIMANLGMSRNFGEVDLEHLTFPAVMAIDYIRVYQDPSNINIGCDPPNFPTAEYIKTYPEAYANPNLTTWVDDYKQPFPKNSLVDGC